MKRSYFFSITLTDETGRNQSRIIKHRSRELTAPVINAQLEESSNFQPVIIQTVNYLGKMSDSYFETGMKSLADYRWPKVMLVLLVCICGGVAIYW